MEGTPDQAPPAEPRQAPAGPPGFLSRLLDARVSVAFLAAVVGVYLLCWHDGGSLLMIPNDVAVKHGAYDWASVRDRGQWWRFFSGLFVTRMGLGALIYVFLFVQLGPAAEKTLGTVRFIVLYVGSGVGAIAFAEVFDPGLRLVGPIVPAYALLGAIPGMTLASTRSLRRTAGDPNVQSAMFWIVFALLIGMMIPNSYKDYVSVGAAAVLAGLLGFGLLLTRTAPKVGVPVTAVTLLAIGACLTLATQGRAWRNGKLGDRGIPANMAPTQPRPLPGQTPDANGGGLISAPLDANSTQKLVDEARARVDPFLERFGPLPTPPDYDYGGLRPSDLEVDEARQHLDYLRRVINGQNGVDFQLEPERIRLMLLVGKELLPQAVQCASENLDFDPTPMNRALYGLTLMLTHDLVQAEDMLGGAADDQDFVTRCPEVVYHYAFLVFRSQGEEPAKAQFRRFLQLTGDDPDTQPAHLRPLVEQALVQLQ